MISKQIWLVGAGGTDERLVDQVFSVGSFPTGSFLESAYIICHTLWAAVEVAVEGTLS